MREENQGLRETLEAQKAELERYYAGLNAKMRKEYEQKLEELKRSQEEELEDRLAAGVKRVLGQNRRMAEELQLHVQVGRDVVSRVGRGLGRDCNCATQEGLLRAWGQELQLHI